MQAVVQNGFGNEVAPDEGPVDSVERTDGLVQVIDPEGNVWKFPVAEVVISSKRLQDAGWRG